MSADKLEKLANTKFNLKAAKVALLERLDAQLTFAYAGGLFKASHELLAVLNTYDKQGYDTIYLLDEYDNPIRISEVDLFTKMVCQALQCSLLDYAEEYNKLKKVRKGDKL
jgi:hypothetical protein